MRLYIIYYLLFIMCSHKNNNEYFMKLACNIASDNVINGGGPFGCVITKNNIIVGTGSNMVTRENDPTMHAEIVAIRNACKEMNHFNLDGCILYTSCEPCPMCLSAIYWARIKKIYYGNTRKDAKHIGFDDDYIYEEISKKIEERQIVCNQICENEAYESFQLWDEKKIK